MKRLFALVALVVVTVLGVLATRDFGKHDYYPPPTEVWVNIEIDDEHVQETVLWNPLTSASAIPGTFSCIDPKFTPASVEDGDYLVTTVQARKAMTPVTIKCDASTLLVDGGVDSVRLLVGPSGEIEVLDADPALSDGSAAAIWHLSAGSPDVEIVVTNR